MMTQDEELDRARIEGARRLAAQPGADEDALDIYLDLRASNWQPPPKVDPDVLAVREIMARANDHDQSTQYAGWQWRSGTVDKSSAMRNALAAYRAGRAATQQKGG